MHRHEQVALWLHTSVSRWFTPKPPLVSAPISAPDDAASPSFHDKDGPCYSCSGASSPALGVGFLASVLGIRTVNPRDVKLPQNLIASDFPEGYFIDRLICGLSGESNALSPQTLGITVPECPPSLSKNAEIDLHLEGVMPGQFHANAFTQTQNGGCAVQGPQLGDSAYDERSGNDADIMRPGGTYRKQPPKDFDMDPLKPSFWKAMDALVKGIETSSKGDALGRKGGEDAERSSTGGCKREVNALTVRSPSNHARTICSSKRQSQQQRIGHSRSMSVRQQDPATRLSSNSKTLKRTQSSVSTAKAVRSASMPACISPSSLRGIDAERPQRGDGPPQKRLALGRKRLQSAGDHDFLPSSSVEPKQCRASLILKEDPKLFGRICVERTAFRSGEESPIVGSVRASPKRPPFLASVEETPRRTSTTCLQALEHDSFSERAVGRAAAEAAASALQALRTRDDPVISFAAKWLAGLKDRLRTFSESASFQDTGTTNRIKVGGAQIQKLRVLQLVKRNLKEELKDYNSSFIAAFKRTPLREDKEPLRPVYEQYHLLKEHIDHICQKDSWPESMSESLATAKLPTSREKSRAGATHGAALDSSGASEVSGSTDRVAVGIHNEAQRKQRKGCENMIERLQRERRDLGEQLATFHTAFKEKTGRPVRLKADIAPVRNEYRRFVEVSKQIEELSRALENPSGLK